MKKPIARRLPDSETKVPFGCGPGLQRGTLLFRRLKAAVEGGAGRTLTYKELSEFTGEPKSTLGNWIAGDGQPSPETILRLMELLPQQQRNAIFNEPGLLRTYPTLEHPRLAYNPTMVSYLGTILAKTKGVTVVQGDRETFVTFLITALGHSCRKLSENYRAVLGLDSHAPDWFVPIPGVKYLSNVFHPHQQEQEIEAIWPKLSSTAGALIIFNGICDKVTGFTEKVQVLAKECHVLVGERLRSRTLMSTGRPQHLITVVADRTQFDGIQAEIVAT